jgi:hypothetical protein
LSSSLHIDPTTLEEVPRQALPKLLLIDTVYNQCLMALHASVVPLFSWSAAETHSLSATQVSAQVAFDHACAASTLFEAMLNTVQDCGTLPSFIGYAAYCGCAILIPFLWCTNQDVRDRAKAMVRTNAAVIHAMAKYWAFTSLSVSYARTISDRNS